jgi:FMS-like tyrosine kinase 1
VFLIIVLVFVLIAIIVVFGIFCKFFCDYKRNVRETNGTYYGNFYNGDIDTFNPILGISNQANLLPYDERFEFPKENLQLEKRLGSGAFGVVTKGIAQNILPYETETVVAVKTVSTTADNEAFGALITELKIMVHLGKHLNIVNLLGAVTKKIAKRELLMIVEFCCFGNLQDFLQSHRESFSNQIVDDEILVAADDNVNKAQTSQLSYAAMPRITLDKNVINMDVLIDGSQISVNTTDLVSWAFQVANGMDYLATRKIVHGDLAARNVLLCEGHIVKICDFGLAKSLYRNYTYQCKKNAKLPFKWLALEVMTDRLFSVQSDVWAYGE